MRRVTRLPLNKREIKYLTKRQERTDAKGIAGTLVATKEWDPARKTVTMNRVLSTLQRMMGPRERCMYCVDSHGADIEHFWPKTPYPERMFDWSNLLLCCTECGRKKGDRFPLDGGKPLLVDPTAEEPWEHLDFDPPTGNLVARFDLTTNAYSAKGLKTVEILELDRREGMAAGYVKTFRRLASKVSKWLQEQDLEPEALMEVLKEEDDHGLLGWCFIGTGRNVSPFRDLREQHPDAWNRCIPVVRTL